MRTRLRAKAKAGPRSVRTKARIQKAIAEGWGGTISTWLMLHGLRAYGSVFVLRLPSPSSASAMSRRRTERGTLHYVFSLDSYQDIICLHRGFEEVVLMPT